jgi:hypothetical protein
MDIVTSFAGLSLLIVIGKFLRVKIKLLQRLYIPTPVIGGILGLLILQIAGDAVPAGWTAGWSQLPGFLINIVFAALFLGITIPSLSTIWKKSAPPKEWPGDSSYSMVMALKDASLQPDNIDFINASANGSLHGDDMEADSIHRVFCSNKTPVLISSIKGTMGECYGASGAMQCISTVFSINQNIVPPTLNCINPITKIAPYIVMGQKEERKIMNAIINSTDCYGFNSSLIISKFDRDFSD